MEYWRSIQLTITALADQAQKTVDAIDNRTLLGTKGNEGCRISILPNEILANIFEFSVLRDDQPLERDDSSSGMIDTRHAITGTCSCWRDLARAIPGLWYLIDLRPPTDRRGRQLAWDERREHVLQSLHLSKAKNIVFRLVLNDEMTETELRDLEQLLRPHTQRCVALSIVSNETIAGMFRIWEDASAFPNLNGLGIKRTSDVVGLSEAPVPTPSTDQPVRSVRPKFLNYTGPPPGSARRQSSLLCHLDGSRLTHMDLYVHEEEFLLLVDMLRSCPELLDLAMCFTGVSDPPLQVPASSNITLLKLERLALAHGPIMELGSMIYAPHVPQLVFQTNEAHSEESMVLFTERFPTLRVCDFRMAHRDSATWMLHHCYLLESVQKVEMGYSTGALTALSGLNALRDEGVDSPRPTPKCITLNCLYIKSTAIPDMAVSIGGLYSQEPLAFTLRLRLPSAFDAGALCALAGVSIIRDFVDPPVGFEL